MAFLLRHTCMTYMQIMFEIYVLLDTSVYDTRIDYKIVKIVRYSNQELLLFLKQEMWTMIFQFMS